MKGVALQFGSDKWRLLHVGLVASLAVTLLLSSQSLSAAPTQAEIDQLQSQISTLRGQLDELEDRLHQMQQSEGAPRPSSVSPTKTDSIPPQPIATQPTRADRFVWTNAGPGELPRASRSPTYWRIPGSDSEVRFSGYIRMGAYKDLIDNLGSFKFGAGNIHPLGSPIRKQTGNIEAQLRLSRISFDSITPTKLGDLSTVLAVDFAGAEPNSYSAEALQNNGYHFRLTHAFANLGPFSLFGIPSEILVGQTWSNFLDEPDTAETLDPSGPASVPSERQPQIRYTMRFGKQTLSIALENPIGEYQLPGMALASSVNNTSTTNRWPDISASYVVTNKMAHAQLSAIVRHFMVDDGVGHVSSALGYGTILGGTLTFSASDQFGGEAWYGDGIGKFIPAEFGTPNGFAVNGYGTDLVRARTQTSYGTSLWLRHFWAPDWRSNFAIGFSRQRYAYFVVPAPDQAPELRTAHINLIYSPLPIIDVGMEVEYGRKRFRRELNLDDADALRLDFSWRARFN